MAYNTIIETADMVHACYLEDEDEKEILAIVSGKVSGRIERLTLIYYRCLDEDKNDEVQD